MRQERTVLGSKEKVEAMKGGAAPTWINSPAVQWSRVHWPEPGTKDFTTTTQLFNKSTRLCEHTLHSKNLPYTFYAIGCLHVLLWMGAHILSPSRRWLLEEWRQLKKGLFYRKETGGGRISFTVPLKPLLRGIAEGQEWDLFSYTHTEGCKCNQLCQAGRWQLSPT